MSHEFNRWIYDLVFCGECGAHVPVFHDLAPPEQAMLEAWETDDSTRYPDVAKETGLPLHQAKAWLVHLHRPLQPKGKINSTPCPHCGRWLRTPKAQHCYHCSADWH